MDRNDQLYVSQGSSTTIKVGDIIDAAASAATGDVSWDDVQDKPSTFPPEIGTTSTTALAGNTAIPEASTATPLVAGTGSAGTAATFSRGDHVHPAQTSVSGNAGTATQLATARTIALTGGATASGTFNGSANLSLAVTLATPTASVRGGVTQQAAIADLTAAPSETDFNGLLAALRSAGILAAS